MSNNRNDSNTLRDKLLRRGLLWLQGTSQVGCFDGIRIVDTQGNPFFRDVTLSALALIKEIDVLRFRRLQRNVQWIVNCALPDGGGQYHYSTRTCRVDFEISADESDPEYVVALVARTLIHEGTHGVLRAHGVERTQDLHDRIERCCIRQEHKFLARLAGRNPELAKMLWREFDPLRAGFHPDRPMRSFSALVKRLLG